MTASAAENATHVRTRPTTAQTRNGANTTSAVCLVKNAQPPSRPATTAADSVVPKRSRVRDASVKARKSESTRATSNHAPEISKLAASSPAESRPARRSPHSRATRCPTSAKQRSDERKETSRRGRKPSPSSRANHAEPWK